MLIILINYRSASISGPWGYIETKKNKYLSKPLKMKKKSFFKFLSIYSYLSLAIVSLSKK